MAGLSVEHDQEKASQDEGDIEVVEARAYKGTTSWHERLGHLHGNAMRKIPIETVKEESKRQDELCGVCEKGKMTKVTFPKTAHHMCHRPLEIVHSDVSGRAQCRSLSGGNYFVTFIDDFSRYMYVRIISRKSEVFRCFKEYQMEVEALHQSRICALQTDNGGEYTGVDFENCLKERGILHRKTVPRNPEQNGVSERANRTSVEMSRCLLIQSGLPDYLWGEAVNTACHIRNLCPSTAIGDKIPLELWKGKGCDIQGEIDRLRVFGCRVWYLKSPGEGKFDSRADEGIFVGYDRQVKGYRIYLPKTKRVIISCHVRFEENVFPYKRMKVDARNIKRRFTEWIWDVEYFELQGGGNTTDIETQSNGENDEGHSDYFLDSLTNENSQQEVVSAQIVPRRSARLHKPKTCNSCACVATACRKQGSCESVNVHDALKGPDAQKWTDAIAKELENLANKDVWDIVKRPLDRNVIDCRWVLVIKRDPDRHKARLVARGFWQRPGIDYSETFSPIVKRRTLRILLTLCAENEWCYEHIDVECAYLNSPLDEDIYMEQPDFYKVPGKDRTQYVCKLKKSLYGLKQAGRVSFKYINCILRDMNLNPCVSDRCMYVNTSKDLIVAVYVDDILVSVRRL